MSTVLEVASRWRSGSVQSFIVPVTQAGWKSCRGSGEQSRGSRHPGGPVLMRAARGRSRARLGVLQQHAHALGEDGAGIGGRQGGTHAALPQLQSLHKRTRPWLIWSQRPFDEMWSGLAGYSAKLFFEVKNPTDFEGLSGHDKKKKKQESYFLKTMSIII